MSILTQPRIIENPAMLAIQQRNSEKHAVEGEKPPTTVLTPTKYPVRHGVVILIIFLKRHIIIQTKQIEVRTPNGKRRITPIFVAPQEELG